MSILKDKEEIYTDAIFKSSNKPTLRPQTTPQVVKKEKEKVKGEIKEWSSNDKELIDWFLSLDPNLYPKTPFILKPGEQVIDFFSALKEEIRRGPNQYRARNGVLQDDIRCLKKIVERNKDGQSQES